jgi:hypothetical protein
VVFSTKLGLSDRTDLPDSAPVVRNGVTVHYFPLDGPPGIRSSGLAAAVRARAGEFDLMHVTGVWQPTSVPACREARRRSIPYVVSPRGALSRYSFAQKWLKKAVYWWGWERRNVNDAAAVHYTALAEQEECSRLGLGPPGFVVPNSIDLHAWRADVAGARAWRARHGIEPSSALFHADAQPLHLATPDGVAEFGSTVVLSEIKTTGHAWRSIPRSYLRQVWWQQYVLGAERTLVVWEQHDEFVPVTGEPQCQWVERDDNEIHVLVGRANRLLELLHR